MVTSKPKVVAVGGGTGTSVVFSGLKSYEIDLTAIVSVADSGGSTGRLRDEFGFQPVGDLRQSLAALAREDTQAWIRKLLLYRFSHGQGLEGHNLGNLILTALQDMAGSTPKALAIAASIFGLHGNVFPSTAENVDLVVNYSDGSFIIGEHNLNPGENGGKTINQIYLSPKAKGYPKALQAVEEATAVVIGPGDLYASILPNFLVEGMSESVKKNKGKIIYILNLMTRYTQTHNYTASQHVSEIVKYVGRKPDYIIVNAEPIPKHICAIYEKEKEYPVEYDLNHKSFTVITEPLLSVVETGNEKGDSIKRSLLRHDEEKLGRVIYSLIVRGQY